MTVEKHTDYEVRAELLKTMAHPIRLQIVHDLLAAGRRNVRCMEAHTGMSQSCISQHLQRLRSAGVVAAERVGNEVYYRAISGEAAKVVAALMGEEAETYVI